MAEITKTEHQEKLYQYYKTFNIVFSEAFLGYKTVASGLVVQTNSLNPVASIATSLGELIPMFGSLFNVMKAGMLKYNEDKTQNKAKHMSSIALNTSQMDDMVEYASRKITLDEDKKEEILSISEKPPKKFVKFFLKWKDAAIVNNYNTPQKKLALKDANMLIMACILGLIDSSKQPDEIQKDFVKVIVKGKFEDDLFDADDEKSATTATVKEDHTPHTANSAHSKSEVVDEKLCVIF